MANSGCGTSSSVLHDSSDARDGITRQRHASRGCPMPWVGRRPTAQGCLNLEDSPTGSQVSEPADPGRCGGQGRDRTADLAVFSRTLYRLSYLPGGPGLVAPVRAVPTGFEPATSALTGRRAQPSCSTGPRMVVSSCAPSGVRIRVATLKGWCPRPLDDGGPARLRGGPRRPRTDDTPVKSRVLYQLS